MSNSEGRVAMAQGRIVWVVGGRSENLFKGNAQTIFGSNTPKLSPTGEQQVQFGFGLAISKAELATPVGGDLWLKMHEEAYLMFPSRVIPPAFAMKFKDGDGIDDQGKSFALREGHQGCLVFALTTNLPIRYFKWENGQNVQISDGIKCGDYVNVQVMVKSHAAIGQGKAGLYLNPMAVQLVAQGKEIINAPTGDQVFGVTMPGAPVGYVPPPAPTAPPLPVVTAPAPMMPAPAAPAAHYGVLPPQHQPPPGGLPAPYPGAVAPLPGTVHQAYPTNAAPVMPAPGAMPPIPR